jgi:hypothetical protein
MLVLTRHPKPDLLRVLHSLIHYAFPGPMEGGRWGELLSWLETEGLREVKRQ